MTLPMTWPGCQTALVRKENEITYAPIQGQCPVCHQDSANRAFQAGAASRDAEIAELNNRLVTLGGIASTHVGEKEKLREQVVLLQRQVSADVAQILTLLDVIDSARGPSAATEGIQEHAQHIEKIALAATKP